MKTNTEQQNIAFVVPFVSVLDKHVFFIYSLQWLFFSSTVDEPCELGCDGLSFCTNFNNRPTELFRSCTSQADEAARNDVLQWQRQRELGLPGLTLPLLNASTCSPNVWKAVACTLQIKPCSRRAHANQICRDVCLDILSQCVDWAQVAQEHSAESICAGLSPEDPDEACISLESFLRPADSGYERIDGQVCFCYICFIYNGYESANTQTFLNGI